MIVSNCCGATFTYPGYPDSNMCSECHENADGYEDEDETKWKMNWERNYNEK